MRLARVELRRFNSSWGPQCQGIGTRAAKTDGFAASVVLASNIDLHDAASFAFPSQPLGIAYTNEIWN